MARKSRKNTDAVIAEPVTENVYYNAAAYIRLSSDDKKKRGDSLETQRNIIENYIASAPDVRLYKVYSDNNATGTNFERPGFHQMLMDAESGKINCIIVKDLTRFGRNAIDAGYYLEKYLPTLDVRFIAVTDGFDTNDGDGGILIPLKNIISESYALDISRKCRAVQQQNINDGRFVGRLAPFGYSKAPDDCRKLIVDEEAASIVRQIFDWALQGIGLSVIVRRLNDDGVITPSRYKEASGLVVNNKNGGSKYWHFGTVKSILQDRVYVGDMVQGKTKKINQKQIAVSPDDWVCVPNTHEPVISRDVYENVQAHIKASSEHDKSKRREASAYSENPFTGKVFCDKCGYAMHRNRQNKDGAYWLRCHSQWKYSKDACTVVSVKESDLKTGVLIMLNKHSEAIRGKLIGLESDVKKPALDEADAELREINSSLDKDGRMLRSLYENMVRGMITAEEFTQMKTGYEAKIAALSNRADEIRNARKDTESRIEEYRDITDAIAMIEDSESLTAEIIGRLVDKILVYPDKSFEVFLRYGNEFREVSA